MALDIRLDPVTKVKDPEGTVGSVKETRLAFKKVDDFLKTLADNSTDPAFLRAVALARTHNEAASMYSVKSLYLLWEEK